MGHVGLIGPNYYEANDKEAHQPIENPNAAYPTSISRPIFTGETVSTELPMHLMPPLSRAVRMGLTQTAQRECEAHHVSQNSKEARFSELDLRMANDAGMKQF